MYFYEVKPMTLRQKFVIAAIGLIVLCQPGFSAEPVRKEATKKISADTRKKYPKGLLATGMAACATDIEKWCKDAVPGQGRLGRCLYSHFAELSPSCLKFAGHGGAGQEEESLIDIDRNYRVETSSQPGGGKKQ